MVVHKKRNRAGVYHYVVFSMLLLAVGFSSGWELRFGKQPELLSIDIETIRQVFPEATNWVEFQEDIYFIGSASDTIGLGILATDNPGYGGNVPLFIGLMNDTIQKVLLLSNSETQEFLDYVAEDKLINQWDGLSVNQVPKADVDVVSGATQTSQAIIIGMRKGAANYLNQPVTQTAPSFNGIMKDIVFLSVALLSVVMAYSRSLRKYRWVYLIIILFVLGIYTGKILSIKLIYGWLSKGFAWQTNWQSALLMMLALTMPLLQRPKFYCNYLCPMGALQELINKISPVKKKHIRLKNSPVSLSEIYLMLIAASLVLGFQPQLSILEPFMVFMFQVAGVVLFVFAAAIALLSFFYNKPWCAICPTGCLINKVHNK